MVYYVTCKPIENMINCSRGGKMDRIKKIMATILELFKEYKSILIVSLIGLLCVELLNHPNNDLIDTLVWIFSHKRVLVMNYIIYVNIGVILYLIINRLN